MLRRVAVLTSESELASPEALSLARRVGAALAQRSIVVFTSGVSLGASGTVADAALRCAGRVIGVVTDATPEALLHRGLSECHRAADVVAQHRQLAALTEAMLYLPGSVGSIAEVVQRKRLTASRDLAVGLLDEQGWFSELMAHADDEALEEFVRESQRGSLVLGRELDELLARLESYRSPESRRGAAVDDSF